MFTYSFELGDLEQRMYSKTDVLLEKKNSKMQLLIHSLCKLISQIEGGEVTQGI